MSISPQAKEAEKMLVDHFGAETQGFQGLVDQNDRGKAFSPRKLTFSSRNFFNFTEKNLL